ncbi:hypothetical protein [Streptomyces sp. NPDC046197]|uniref:hypothetical protein n=1 Tax=Streptomyces sp. NPDC046197 TaxID=3154337 RepID=UPI0033F34EA4
MDHFERELARMMRDTREHTPFRPRHQERLRAGVRTRRRTRMAQKAVGSVLVLAGLGAGLVLLPRGTAADRPQAPLTRPGGPSPSTMPGATPTPSASVTVPAAPTGTGASGDPGATTSAPAPDPSGTVFPTSLPPDPPGVTATAHGSPPPTSRATGTTSTPTYPGDAPSSTVTPYRSG